MTPPKRLASWLPDRGEVIWINHNPQAGREMKNHDPLGALASPIPDRPDAHSYVLCHQLKSFDWKARGARPHPMGLLSDTQLEP
ncbi:MAG: type II toxin-antitoxin system PemK/MazF family toxin, partial [Cyanobacteriota bacterium]|nr:type II toxin-antitoxin system PemK/MazF family toxin [Cyanobacteriota bacterium]